MAFVKEQGICPICKNSAVVTRKWVLNKYKTRYNYLIYHHSGTVHYSNVTSAKTRSFKKGELKKLLINTINSESFKSGLFRAEDVRKALFREYPSIIIDSIRDNLYRLADSGMLESVKRGRNVFFLNAVYKERLSFVDDSKKILLTDLDNDLMFKGHVSIGTIRNDKSWPLYYLPYRIFGDSDKRFKDLEFKAFNVTDQEELKTVMIEDNPREKRLLLKLAKPLFPNETMTVRFEYNWQEPKQTFFFTTAAHLKSFEFKFLGNMPVKILVTQTISTLNQMKDLSNSIAPGKSKGWKFVYVFKLKDMKPFSIIQFRWKHA
jgi:Fe2+ or Zn2+ uptake regulation protein